MTPFEKRSAVEDQFGEDLLRLRAKLAGSEEAAIEAFCPPERAWLPIMSDTPAEILEHDHALLNAKGVVVITGLGLGCLPHALLAKGDEIEHIHIIEIDPQVIRLTGKYLKKNPKVTIHKGSALDIRKFLPAGTRVDYVWHDIWSHISSKNFTDDTAEHGISYGRLFTLYADHLDVRDTSAWALREATIQKRVEDERAKEEREFEERVRTLPLDEQVEETYDRIIRSKLVVAGDRDPFAQHDRIPEEVCRVLDPDGGLKKHVRLQLSDPNFWDQYSAHKDALEPDRLDHPNRHLEAR